VLAGLRQATVYWATSESAKGITAQLDSIRPGIVSDFSFHFPELDAAVTLSGHLVVVRWGGQSASGHCRWNLPNATLAPDIPYRLFLSATRLEVLPLV